MKAGQRGYSNEIRTMDYLEKKGWVCIRAGGSKGVLEIDVLAYHLQTGEIKHIQSKSNGHYTAQDIHLWRTIRSVIKAPNVSFELWDWYDRNRYPVITVYNSDGTEVKYSEDPKMVQLMKGQ